MIVDKKIIIIEDNPDVRNGFCFFINSMVGFSVIDTFESCELAFMKINDLRPDIVLMDIDLPGMNGIEGTRYIKSILPEIEILMITIFENSNRVFEALCAGASGYLTKNTNPTQLFNALEEICIGGAPMSANIARMVAKSFYVPFSQLLTDREVEVLKLLVDGKSYKTIAEILRISLSTVKFHIKNIYMKLQVNSKEDAISKAKSEKMV